MSTLYETMLRSFITCNGIEVCPVGEDDITFVALGHEPAKQVLQAFNVMARQLGWRDVLDGDGQFAPKAWREQVLDRFEQTWAVVKDRCDKAGKTDHDPDCRECAEIEEVQWWLQWDLDGETAGAFPVTIWRSW